MKMFLACLLSLSVSAILAGGCDQPQDAEDPGPSRALSPIRIRDGADNAMKMLRDATPDAVSCSQDGETLEQFLVLAPLIGNAELNEFLSEVIEQTIVNQPDCFLETWSDLNEWQKDWVAVVVAHPVYSPYDELKVALQRSAQTGLAGDMLSRTEGLRNKTHEWPSLKAP